MIKRQQIFREYDFKIEYIKGSNDFIMNLLSRKYNEEDLCQNIKGIVMCSKGEKMLHKDNFLTYDRIAMIDDAEEELKVNFVQKKSLQNYPELHNNILAAC